MLQAGSLHAYLGYVIAHRRHSRALRVVDTMTMDATARDRRAAGPRHSSDECRGDAHRWLVNARAVPVGWRFGGSIAGIGDDRRRRRVRPRLGSRDRRHAVPHMASGTRARLFRDAVVGVVSHSAGSPWRSPSRSTAWATSPTRYARRARPPSACAFNVAARRESSVVFVANNVIGISVARWEVMTLATAALVATEHESRDEPACCVSLSGHVPRRHRRSGRRLPHPRVRRRLAVVCRRC